MRRKSKKVKQRPQVIIIAGPNGAGKTTFATEYIPEEFKTPNFVNADLIARGISPFAPEKVAIEAGKLMLRRIAEHVAARESFSIETTLSGSNYVRHIPRWRANGYQVILIFLKLSSPQLAIHRVRARMRQGGHAIPDEVIRRRYHAGLNNLHALYLNLVDEWLIFENSRRTPRLVKHGKNCSITKNRRLTQVQRIERAMRRASNKAFRLARQTNTPFVVETSRPRRKIKVVK